MPDDPSLPSFLRSTLTDRMAHLDEFLRIRSISSLPEHEADCLRAAEWLADHMRSIGLDNVEIAPTGGKPVVYADWLHTPGRPTLLVYGHYDVQPVEPVAEWLSEPFEPYVTDEAIIARGVADDKGQILIHLDAAATLLKCDGRLPVNVRYMFEGEEESDDEHLDNWLLERREQLTADFAVVSDTGFFDGDRPAITLSLRGISCMQVNISGTPAQLHSGTHGGVVRNPARVLAQILASMVDGDGRVAIRGFYDHVLPLEESDRTMLAELPFDEAGYLRQIGASTMFGEIGYSTLERRGARPTVDINGMWSGYQGAGTQTIIPASAHAKISCRLVPDQDPAAVAALIERHVHEGTPPGLVATFDYTGGGLPVKVPADRWFVRAASDAVETCFGQRPVFVYEGGSVPAAEALARVLGIEPVLLGFTPASCNAHAPNEWMSRDFYERGVLTIMEFMRLVGERGAISPPADRPKNEEDSHNE